GRGSELRPHRPSTRGPIRPRGFDSSRASFGCFEPYIDRPWKRSPGSVQKTSSECQDPLQPFSTFNYIQSVPPLLLGTFRWPSMGSNLRPFWDPRRDFCSPACWRLRIAIEPAIDSSPSPWLCSP